MFLQWNEPAAPALGGFPAQTPAPVTDDWSTPVNSWGAEATTPAAPAPGTPADAPVPAPAPATDSWGGASAENWS